MTKKSAVNDFSNLVSFTFNKFSQMYQFILNFLQLSKNEAPAYEIISGAAIAFAALLLIIPGFATDIFGFLIIFPITRKFLINKFANKFRNKENKNNNFIDGDFEDIDDDNDRKI